MVVGSNLWLVGVNGGVVHGLGFESLSFWSQWWCSAWSWVRILGVNGGVVHGLGFESLTFWESMAENSTFWAHRRSHIQKQCRLSEAHFTFDLRITYPYGPYVFSIRIRDTLWRCWKSLLSGTSLQWYSLWNGTRFIIGKYTCIWAFLIVYHYQMILVCN
jgi:hypothetical protein